MKPQLSANASLPEVHGSIATKQPTFLRRMFAFAGPAYLVSVGYMDPGNWATDLEGGARFGYQLLWVLVLSNLMAILLQTLSARWGIIAGRDLAQACREAYPPRRLTAPSGSYARSPSRPATWRRCWALPSDSTCCSESPSPRACC